VERFHDNNKSAEFHSVFIYSLLKLYDEEESSSAIIKSPFSTNISSKLATRRRRAKHTASCSHG